MNVLGECQSAEYKKPTWDPPRKSEQPNTAKPNLPLEINSGGNATLQADRYLEAESWLNAPGERQSAKCKETTRDPPANPNSQKWKRQTYL